MRWHRAQPPLRRSDAVARRYRYDPADHRGGEAARHYGARPYHRREGGACEPAGARGDLEGWMQMPWCARLLVMVAAMAFAQGCGTANEAVPDAIERCMCKGCGCKAALDGATMKVDVVFHMRMLCDGHSSYASVLCQFGFDRPQASTGVSSLPRSRLRQSIDAREVACAETRRIRPPSSYDA